MRPHRLQSRGQRALARDAQIGRCACHADVHETPEEVRDPLRKPIDTDEEYRFELKTLNVLHVEDADLARVADRLALFESGDRNAPRGQQGADAVDHAIDQVVPIRALNATGASAIRTFTPGPDGGRNTGSRNA
jgi:hypothetical protein